MKHIFILGRLPTLSIAEILSVFERDKIKYEILGLSDSVLVIDFADPFREEQRFLNRLGGTIKIIEVFGEVNKVSDLRDALNAEALMDKYPNLQKELKNIPFGKFYWGLSVYFLYGVDLHVQKRIKEEVVSYLMGVKEILRERLIRCRIVTPPPNKMTLDAPAVIKNNLLTKGGEIVAAVGRDKTYWGKTLAIQNFESYEFRDYGRPSRNMKIGMMPPKLAQMMVNLSGSPLDGTILDPFCGTGVVLQEALLMGYKSVVGSDIDKVAMDAAKKNLDWLVAEAKKDSVCLLENGQTMQLFQKDVAEINKVVPPDSIDAIVTEGTLGPRYSHKPPNAAQVASNFQMLENMYLGAFKEFKTALKSGGKVVITFPVYSISRDKLELAPFVDKIKQLGYDIQSPIKDENLKNNPLISLTGRKTVIYSRPDQIVGREIVIFVKNN